jgi:hypothetical protein
MRPSALGRWRYLPVVGDGAGSAEVDQARNCEIFGDELVRLIDSQS